MGSRDLIDDVILIGQSPSASVMPTALETAVTAKGRAGQDDAPIIIDAPVFYNREHSEDAEGEGAYPELSTSEYVISEINEAVTLLSHLARSDVFE